MFTNAKLGSNTLFSSRWVEKQTGISVPWSVTEHSINQLHHARKTQKGSQKQAAKWKVTQKTYWWQLSPGYGKLKRQRKDRRLPTVQDRKRKGGMTKWIKENWGGQQNYLVTDFPSSGICNTKSESYCQPWLLNGTWSIKFITVPKTLVVGKLGAGDIWKLNFLLTFSTNLKVLYKTHWSTYTLRRRQKKKNFFT